MKKFNLLLFLFLISVVFAQEAATISGFVRDDASGEPLAYTNIFVKESNIGSAANIDGYYVLTNLSAGTQEVVASIIGYGMETKEVNVQAGQELRLDFRLKRTVLE